MEIHFCAKCNSRLTDMDIERGTAVQVGEDVFCRKCSPVIPVGPPAGVRKPGQTNRGAAIKASGLRGATRGPRASGFRTPTRSTPAYTPARTGSRTPAPLNPTVRETPPPAGRRTPPPAARQTPPGSQQAPPPGQQEAGNAPPSGQQEAGKAPPPQSDQRHTPHKGSSGIVPAPAREAIGDPSRRTGYARPIQAPKEEKGSIMGPVLIGICIGAAIFALYYFLVAQNSGKPKGEGHPPRDPAMSVVLKRPDCRRQG